MPSLGLISRQLPREGDNHLLMVNKNRKLLGRCLALRDRLHWGRHAETTTFDLLRTVCIHTGQWPTPEVLDSLTNQLQTSLHQYDEQKKQTALQNWKRRLQKWHAASAFLHVAISFTV